MALPNNEITQYVAQSDFNEFKSVVSNDISELKSEIRSDIKMLKENFERQRELSTANYKRVADKLDTLSPEAFADALELKTQERLSQKSETANTVGLGMLFILGIFIVLAFTSTMILILNGYSEHLDQLGTKVLQPLFIALVSLVSMMVGYYFSKNEDS